MSKRISRIQNISKEMLENAVSKSCSMRQALHTLELDTGSNSYHVLKKRLLEEKIDFSSIFSININDRRESRKKKPRSRPRIIPLEDILVIDSDYSRYNLKKRLIAGGILKNICDVCGCEPVWRGERLALVLDHKNGNATDNRLKNLRLLCPNCNSQTPNFSGRNRSYKKPRYYCQKCREEVSSRLSELCKKCYNESPKVYLRKVKDRPSKEDLLKMVWEKPTSHIARDFKVSDKAIEQWCKSYGIDKPPRGYWEKKKAVKFNL